METIFLKQMSILTDQTRLKIIYILSTNNYCAMHLEKLLQVSQPNVSRHLDKMINANIVLVQKVGRRNIYSLNPIFKKNNSQIIEQITTLYHDEFDQNILRQYKEECDALTKS